MIERFSPDNGLEPIDSRPWWHFSRQEIARIGMSVAVLLPPTIAGEMFLFDGNHKPVAATATSTAPDVDNSLAGSLHGHCMPPDDLKSRQRQAAACLAQQHGTIDLVNFDGLSSEAANQVADQSTKLLEQASGGIIDAKYKVIPASKLAKAGLAKWNAGASCQKDIMGASEAADYMPVTRKAAVVEALLPYSNCAGDAGLADDDRLADIYLPGFNLKQSNKTIADILAPGVVHETLHDFGPGHYGDLEFKLGYSHDQIRREIDGQLEALQKNVPTNIKEQMDHGYTFNEYSASGFFSSKTRETMDNVMGTVDLPEKSGYSVGPTPMQLNTFLWPKAALEGKKNLLDVPVSKNHPARLDEKEVNTNKYFSIRLKDPITLKISGDSDPNHVSTFDELDVVPFYGQDFDGPNPMSTRAVKGASMFLGNESAQSAYMGEMDINRPTNEINVAVGSQTLIVRRAGKFAVAQVEKTKPQELLPLVKMLPLGAEK